jgi:hypothetical protein
VSNARKKSVERAVEVAEVLRRVAPTPARRLYRAVDLMLAEDGDPVAASRGVAAARRVGTLVDFRREQGGPILLALRSDLLMGAQDLITSLRASRMLAEAMRRIEARRDVPFADRVAAGQLAATLEADAGWLVELLGRKRRLDS